MRFLIPAFFLFLLSFFVFVAPASAVCPVCTVVVGSSLGVSRWLGIDDSVTGVWVGGLILSSSFWLVAWIEKKGWNIPHRNAVSIGFFYIFAVIPLYWVSIMGIEGNVLWGLDKILVGIVFGSVAFWLGVRFDKWLRRVNNEEVFIYYQKALIPVLFLTLMSFGLYLITL